MKIFILLSSEDPCLKRLRVSLSDCRDAVTSAVSSHCPRQMMKCWHQNIQEQGNENIVGRKVSGETGGVDTGGINSFP